MKPCDWHSWSLWNSLSSCVRLWTRNLSHYSCNPTCHSHSLSPLSLPPSFTFLISSSSFSDIPSTLPSHNPHPLPYCSRLSRIFSVSCSLVKYVSCGSPSVRLSVCAARDATISVVRPRNDGRAAAIPLDWVVAGRSLRHPFSVTAGGMES